MDQEPLRVNGVLSEDFMVKVGVHQGSVLNPFQFAMVFEILSSNFKIGFLLSKLLYVDDLILIDDNMEKAVEKLRK